MSRALVFCAAEFDGLAAPIEKTDTVIAADGGLRHTQALGLTPHVLLGDFDSLGFVPEGAEVFPVEKDDTDAMLAARKALSLGCGEVWFYGGLDGKRLDHTVANFQTLQFLADRDCFGYLIGRDYILTVVKNGKLAFPAGSTGIFSLFCLGPDATGVSIRGLHYELENGVLTAGFPLGVSNHFTGKKCEIKVENGSLLAIWDRKNGFPQR